MPMKHKDCEEPNEPATLTNQELSNPNANK
jgi:hypothetical protein